MTFSQVKSSPNSKKMKFSSKFRKFFSLSLIHISEPTRLGMISYAVFCLKKNRNFKIEAEFGGLWGGKFQGFLARAGKCYRGYHWLMCEQNRGGLLSTVPPPEGAEWGPIENFAPQPRQNWVSDPQFLDFL